MFLACAAQYGIIWFALESSRMPMGGQVSWVILGGNSPFSLVLQLLTRGSIELCVVLWVVTSHLGTYMVCAPYSQISLCAPMGRYVVQP